MAGKNRRECALVRDLVTTKGDEEWTKKEKKESE